MKLLLLLFIISTGCANSATLNEHSPSDTLSTSVDLSDETQNCGRENYPKYQDIENQKVVNSDIGSGSAQVILHFHELGQATLDAFLERTPGVLSVDTLWPDWGSMSITVNESGLRALSEDCTLRIIEANKREYQQ